MEEQKNLVSYRKVVDTVRLTLNVPDNKEYYEVLTALFNNKRDNEEILEVYNYYGNNKITLVVNLTDYAKDNYHDTIEEAQEEAIKHLKRWMNSFLRDNNEDNIEVYRSKASIYYIDEYSSKLQKEMDGKWLDNYYIGE